VKLLIYYKSVHVSPVCTRCNEAGKHKIKVVQLVVMLHHIKSD